MNTITDLREVSTFKLKVEQLARTMDGALNPKLNHFTLIQIEKEISDRAAAKFVEDAKEMLRNSKPIWTGIDMGLDQYSDLQIEEEFIKRNHTEKNSLILSIGNGRTIFDAKGNTGAIHDRLVQAFTQNHKCCDLFAEAISIALFNRLSKLT